MLKTSMQPNCKEKTISSHKPVHTNQITGRGNSNTPMTGFTLLEVLIAVAVLAIAMVSILHSNIQVQNSLISGRETTTLSLLTQNLLADMKTEGVENWSEYYGNFPEHPHYTWSLDIQPTRNKAIDLVVIQVAEAGQQEAIFSLQEYIPAEP